MSHPDPMHDPENTQDEDRFDYQQQLAEQERREQEEYERHWQEYLEVNKAFLRATRIHWSFHKWPLESIK